MNCYRSLLIEEGVPLHDGRVIEPGALRVSRPVRIPIIGQQRATPLHPTVAGPIDLLDPDATNAWGWPRVVGLVDQVWREGREIHVRAMLQPGTEVWPNARLSADLDGLVPGPGTDLTTFPITACALRGCTLVAGSGLPDGWGVLSLRPLRAA